MSYGERNDEANKLVAPSGGREVGEVTFTSGESENNVQEVRKSTWSKGPRTSTFL